MKTKEFAKEHIMEEYLGVMLDEGTDDLQAEQQVEQQRIATLLKQVPQQPPQTVPAETVTEEIQAPLQQAEQTVTNEVKPVASCEHKAAPQQPFQALLFEVAGLTLAVPLTELGGIHQTEKVGSIIGKPSWFMGVMLSRNEKINVVNTAQWVMPEKYTESMESDLDYQYLVMLGTSHWGLGCENLIDTMDLHPDQIKWRQTRSKRPWLAGVVKEKMCALLDVAELIRLLEQGLNSNQQ